MNVLLKKRISRYLTVIATIALISACSTTPTAPEDIPPALFSELESNSGFYLKKDEQLGSDENLIWQFLAIQALVKERQFAMADAIIESLQTKTLTAEQTATLGLLIADNYYAQNKLPETQTALDAIDTLVFNQTDFIYYLKLQAALHIRNDNPLQATDTLLLLAPHLTTDEEKQSYNDLLLAQLTLLTSEQLNQYQVAKEAQLLSEEKDVAETTDGSTESVDSSTETVDSSIETTEVVAPVEDKLAIEHQAFKEGWYALGALYQSNKLRPNRLTRALNDWKNTYPDHAALEFMPLVLTNIAEFSPYQPDNIAVLLPLSGRFEKPGKAIQLGLLNAYYHQKKEATDEQESLPKLHFFDTQTASSEQLAAQLKLANIDFVVGPLMKNEIEELLPLIEDMPVLALNSFAEKIKPEQVPVTDKEVNEITSEGKTAEASEAIVENVQENNQVSWHYAFPLSPEDEAKQAAKMIHSDQHKNPLIIVPKSNYGKRVAAAFREQWNILTPESDVQIEAHYFQSKPQLASFIDDVLQTGKSKRRIDQMQAIAKVPLKTEVRSRRDVDAIYIVSKRDELILLKPFIDVSVSPFAQKIPLYASSRSHSFDRNNTQNKELSRLVFSDNPFLLDQEGELNKEVEQAWKKQSFATLRLFALGYDSYQLIEQLVYLQTTDDTVYKGLIGELKLDQSNSIQAKLSWAKYQNGKLFEVASPAPAE